MTETSHVSALEARLKQQAEQDAQMHERVTRSAFSDSSSTACSSFADHEARITERRMARALFRAWSRPVADRPVDLSRHLRRELGPDALPRGSGPDPHRDAGRGDGDDRAGAGTAPGASGPDVGRVAPRGGGRGEVRSAAPRDVCSTASPGPTECRGSLPCCYRESEGSL